MKKRRKGIFFLAAAAVWCLMPKMLVYASENQAQEPDFSYIDSWLSSCDMGAVNEGMESLFPGIRIDAEEILGMIMRGKFTEAAGMLTGQVKEGILGEVSSFKQILASILVLGILSAVFAEFSDLFSGGQIAQTGFYFLYLSLMVILTRVFLFVSEIASAAMGNILLFIKLFIPTYFTVVGAAGGAAAAAYYYQLMLVLSYLVEGFLNTALIPMIYSYVLLALLNGLWAEEKLGLLLDFIEKGIIAALKVSMGMVTGLSLVQALIVPAASKLRISAVQKTLSAIPGIGGVVEGMTELILGSAVLIKNSMGVLFLVLLLGACVLPLLKILAVAGTVKLGAAITGIVSDKRISACADRVGAGCFLLLRCVFTSIALFVIVIAVISCTVSG